MSSRVRHRAPASRTAESSEADTDVALVGPPVPGPMTGSVLSSGLRLVARRLRCSLLAAGRLVTVGLLLLGASSCLFPTEIEEEEPEADLPPFFDALATTPPLGERTVVLETGFEPFVLHRVSDPNTDQTLYFRVLVDYATIGIATVPEPVPAAQRETINIFHYQYPPCVPQHAPYAEGQERNATLYFAVSDAPFSNPEQLYSDTTAGGRTSLAFATDPAGRAVIAGWFLTLEGECLF